jgi:glycosyltransferase involved in cell wall biosynthesis
MLAPTRLSPGGVPRHIAGFGIAALRGGLSPATDALYRDYRRRLLPEDGDYAGWVARHDTITAELMENLRARAARLGESAPLVSILLPTYQTPERWLRRCIESVLAQAYPRWELCIADDASPDPRVVEVAREYAARDARIRVERREANGHISEASNTALALARGDFVALLDHDDELRPHALLEIAEAIHADPGVGLVYSDEDKLDLEGRRFDPYFKPDFDPDLLRGQNYICHFTAIRTELVRKVGGFRKGFEGSQDHDLILRCTERLRPDQVRHVPKVLYHWRAIPGSTAMSRDAKDYAASAGARAVGEHLSRKHPGARVEELSHGHFRVHWPLPSPAPKVSLVIPTRDRVELLRMCVESILERTTYPDFELVVVDNQSADPGALAYLARLEGRERVRVLRYDHPFNYSAINNWAVAQCDGELVGLVNNDIEAITPEWLEELVSQAVREVVGAVGAMLYYPDDTIQHAGVVLGVHGVAAHRYAGMPRGYPGHGGRTRVAQTLSAVTGACLVVRRAVYEQVGGLDESLAVAFNDIDFCLRLRQAGYRNVWTPFAELYHHESASRGSEDTDEKKARFAREVATMMARWGELLPFDPAYNVNLTLAGNCSELSRPPRAP